MLFLYKQAFELQLPWMDDLARPQHMLRLPVVLSSREMEAVLAGLQGVHGLLAQLLYGTGLRITEALQLRRKDRSRSPELHRGFRQEWQDRVAMLPDSPTLVFRAQLHRAHAQWQADIQAGRGDVQLPDALERTHPRAGPS